MKLALPLLLSATAMPSPSVLPPAPQLGSDLPDSQFRVELTFDPPFLPVNPTLMNIIHFMSVVARSGFDEQIQPRIYSAPTNRQVQITTSAWTEARFLLWGIYLAAIDMIKFIRFHNVIVKLYWESSFVGLINITVRTVSSLADVAENGSRIVTDDGADLNLTGIGNKTAQAFVERLNLPPAQNTTGSDSTDNISIINSVKTYNNEFSIPSTAPTLIRPKILLAPRLTIDFIRPPGALSLTRNDVFIAFFTTMLHLAQFPAENDMRPFNSKSLTDDLRVEMVETGVGCLVMPLTLTNIFLIE